ncbi:hypothetical protein ACFW04_011505 [Cataglyphis niger]
MSSGNYASRAIEGTTSCASTTTRPPIERDILDEINELLAEAETAYGPGLLEARPIEQPPPAPRPPKVGTRIQRSDRENRQKAAMLATPPPPLAACRRRRDYPPPPPPRTPARAKEPPPVAATDMRPPEVLVPMGPAPPPPIMVELEPGLIAPIPHFAVHVSRRYKVRLPQGRWTLRFSASGELRYRRKIA